MASLYVLILVDPSSIPPFPYHLLSLILTSTSLFKYFHPQFYPLYFPLVFVLLCLALLTATTVAGYLYVYLLACLSAFVDLTFVDKLESPGKRKLQSNWPIGKPMDTVLINNVEVETSLLWTVQP